MARKTIIVVWLVALALAPFRLAEAQQAKKVHGIGYLTSNTSSAELQNGFITLYDLAGKMLERIAISGESIEVARNLPPGVYFAKLESGGEIKQVLKLVKN